MCRCLLTVLYAGMIGRRAMNGRRPLFFLAGKTALILGYGAIGGRIARLCRALEMNVLAVRRRVSQTGDDFAREIHPLAALSNLLPRAHALIVSLPHTPETDGLIGTEELGVLGTAVSSSQRGPGTNCAAKGVVRNAA